MAIIGHTVVLLNADECEEYPGTRCVMAVIKADSRQQAEEIAERMPEGFAPHIIPLETPDEYGIIFMKEGHSHERHHELLLTVP